MLPRIFFLNFLYLLYEYAIKKTLIFSLILVFSLFLLGVDIYICNLSSSFFFQKIIRSGDKQEQELSKNVISTLTLKKGDTLTKILKKENINNEDIRKISKIIPLKSRNLLKAGKKVTFEYNINSKKNKGKDLRLILFEIDTMNVLSITKSGTNFCAKINSLPLTKIVTKYKTTVETTVTSSLRKAGVSISNIVKLINIYSGQIDFTKGIKAGDKIILITEKLILSNSKPNSPLCEEILYSSIESKGKKYNMYRYSPTGKEEHYNFFSENGVSTRTKLLKNPVKMVRISSKFGYRNSHPVHGYRTMHKGIDFSAPIGTPIYAAGSGVVDFVGWMSGYGRIIVIKHTSNLSTAYAHASRFTKGLKKGSLVKQGDTIAFVGSSGNVTGPHLHYEIRKNGKKVDPAIFQDAPALQLLGTELISFNKFKKQIPVLESRIDSEIAVIDKKQVNL